jgi:hypothetical protein
VFEVLSLARRTPGGPPGDPAGGPPERWAGTVTHQRRYGYPWGFVGSGLVGVLLGLGRCWGTAGAMLGRWGAKVLPLFARSCALGTSKVIT